MGSVLYQIQHTGLTFQPLTRIVVIPRPCRDSPVPETPTRAHPDKRRSRRAKITRPLRVRPSDPRDDHFEDLPVSVNASKEGIFFTTRRNSYYKGITTFRHFPFQFATRSDELRICGRGSPHDPMNCEYVAEVARVEEFPNGKFGVAVNLKMTMNYSGPKSAA